MKKFKVGLATSALVLVASTITVAGPATVGLSVANAAPSQAPLNLANEQGALWSCAFNPFVPSSLPYSFGLTYESLDFVNALQSGKVTPWLASAYAWSNANKKLTFTIRSGVKWSDGVAFSAADVVYTFNLLKKNPALDLNAVWSVLSSVSSSGNKVVLNFKLAAVPYFFYVAGQVPIVPQHLWSKIAKPETSTIPNPVGTGGYIMSKCTGQNIKWTANPHFWKTGQAQIKVVNMPSFLSNNTCNEYLASGQSAWGSQFIPSIQSSYVAKKAGNAYWFAPVANVALFPNTTVPGLSDAKVRQAISYAINRSTISRIGEYGYEPAASQTGIVSPTFKSWVSSSSSAGLSSSANTTKAASILAADGYKKVNGVYTKGSTKLSFTLTTNGGYSDWIAAMQVLGQELTKFGIKVTLVTPAANTFYANLYAGKYQLAYNAEAGGPTPFYEMRQWLFSKNSAAIGTAASSNWERYSSPSTDALLNQYGTTTSASLQKSIVAKLEGVMVSQAPVIPVLEEVDWFQYNATHISGFPSSTNPYAQPGLYNQPDWGYVLDQLKPKA
jgi:peptide/nickel transport system substrate-binding protein